MHFDGPEKKFELYFCDSKLCLRKLPPSFWGELVRRAKAEIISKISNEYLDAYLLSESSLFVYSDKVVMITCGRTTPVDSMLYLLERVNPSEKLGYAIYERKSSNFPELQRSDALQDAQLLRSRISGEELFLGDREGEHFFAFAYARACDRREGDFTVEVLMHDLSVAEGSSFEAKALIESLGLATHLSQSFETDEKHFSPQGYSMNAISGSSYATFHLTPQAVCSFASFETNISVSRAALSSLLSALVAELGPDRFELLLFRNSPEALEDNLEVGGYRPQTLCRRGDLGGYHFFYSRYFSGGN